MAYSLLLSKPAVHFVAIMLLYIKPLWTHPEPWMLPGHLSEQLTVGFSVSQQGLLVVTAVLTNVEPWLSSSSFMSQICHDHTGSVRNLHGAFLLFTFTHPYVCLLCLFIPLAALFTVVQGKLTTPWAGNIFVHLSCGSDPNVRVASHDRVRCPFFMAITAMKATAWYRWVIVEDIQLIPRRFRNISYDFVETQHLGTTTCNSMWPAELILTCRIMPIHSLCLKQLSKEV